MKYCNKCQQTKPKSEFNKKKSSKDGMQIECRKCQAYINSKRYKDFETRKKIMEQQAKRYTTPRGRAVSLIYSTQRKTQGKRATLEKSLTVEDILPIMEKGVCQLTGLPFDFSKSIETHTNPYAPSIDRIDSQKGYTKDNVRIVLYSVNAALGEYSDEIILPILEAMVKGIKKNAQKRTAT